MPSRLNVCRLHCFSPCRFCEPNFCVAWKKLAFDVNIDCQHNCFRWQKLFSYDRNKAYLSLDTCLSFCSRKALNCYLPIKANSNRQRNTPLSVLLLKNTWKLLLLSTFSTPFWIKESYIYNCSTKKCLWLFSFGHFFTHLEAFEFKEAKLIFALFHCILSVWKRRATVRLDRLIACTIKLSHTLNGRPTYDHKETLTGVPKYLKSNMFAWSFCVA